MSRSGAGRGAVLGPGWHMAGGVSINPRLYKTPFIEQNPVLLGSSTL